VVNGVLVVSLITVSFFKSLDLSSSENKVFILLERMDKRTAYDKILKKIVDNLLIESFFNYKKRKLNNQRGNTNIALEKEKIDREIKSIDNKKKKIEVKLKHLIRDKQKIAK
jgi:hypothetical protein